MRQELLKGLSEEQIAKFKECKSNEEILKVAAEEGVELTDEQLEAVSGGNCINDPTCPNCHQSVPFENGRNDYWYDCPHCGHHFHDNSGGHMS